MNGKTTALAMLIGLSANGFAQKGITRETFLQPKEVSIESSKELMNITIKGREGEPDFHYNRSVVLAQDEPIITRERHTNLDFVIPFSQSGTEEKSKEGNPVFFADGFKCEILRDSTVRISRTPVAFLSTNKADTVFHIPATIEYEGNTYQVKEIAINGFAGNMDIKHLVIDEGIKTIQPWAFICCSNLKSVRIPASVNYIDGLYIFSNCNNLKNIIVASTNKKYDSRDNCNAIIETGSNRIVAGCAETRIPSSVTTIGKGAFSGCENLTCFTIPEGITRIEESAFSSCINLTSISLPQSLEQIEERAFGGCHSLQSIVIPKNVEYIWRNPFVNCSQLKSITVEKGNKDYDSRENCNAIIETEADKLIAACAGTTLIEGIRSIEEYAFEGVSLPHLHFPKSVTHLEQWAFNGFHDATSITVDEDNPAFSSPTGSNALLTKDGKTLIKGCANTIIPEGVVEIGEGAFSGTNIPSPLFLPEGLKIIGHQAFYGCDNLWQVVIPASVETICEHAFAVCQNLNLVQLKGGVKVLHPYTFTNCKQLGIVNLPEGMTTIRDGAFHGCTNLYGVSIPSSLVNIGENAFKDCPCEKDVLEIIEKNKQ